MNKRELKRLAKNAIKRWADESKPKLLGEPCFKVVDEKPMIAAFPIRWVCMGRQGDSCVWWIHAQDTLNYFAELDKASRKVILRPERSKSNN
jgi:hypothetical protein